MRDDDDVRNGRHVPATNGHRPDTAGHPAALTQVLPVVHDAEAPIDLVAVQADDELISALGGAVEFPAPGGPADRAVADRDPIGSFGWDAGVAQTTDDRLVAMLAAWRTEIDAEPIPELVDLDAAVAAVVAGMQTQGSAVRRRRAGRLRHLAPLTAAAAIIVATVTGVGLGSQNAMPGDTLWPIQKVVNPERAESVEAKVAVEGRLSKIRTALQAGDTSTAEQELRAVTTEISSVRGQEGQPQLVQEQQFLSAKLVDTPPGTPADLSTPAKSNPTARPTEAAAPPPPPPAPAPAGSSATEPSVAPSSTEPQPTGPDVSRSAPERASQPVLPSRPGATGPLLPVPESSAPQVTAAPEVTQPPPHRDPRATPPGKSEGRHDPSDAPGPPVEQAPASGTATGGGKSDGDTTPPSPDTTTASGSADTSVRATTAADATT